MLDAEDCLRNLSYGSVGVDAGGLTLPLKGALVSWGVPTRRRGGTSPIAKTVQGISRSGITRKPEERKVRHLSREDTTKMGYARG